MLLTIPIKPNLIGLRQEAQLQKRRGYLGKMKTQRKIWVLLEKKEGVGWIWVSHSEAPLYQRSVFSQDQRKGEA